MVATAKYIADFRQAVVGQLFGQRHSDLTRPGYRARTALGQQIRYFDLVVLSHGALDVIHTHQLVLQGQ